MVASSAQILVGGVGGASPGTPASASMASTATAKQQNRGLKKKPSSPSSASKGSYLSRTNYNSNTNGNNNGGRGTTVATQQQQNGHRVNPPPTNRNSTRSSTSTQNGSGASMLTSPTARSSTRTPTPYEERIRKLMHPPPTSLTLTAALQLLQPHRAPHQSVYLMDRRYLQNWLHWAYQQPVDPDGGEVHRIREALRLAAVQEGLAPPNDDGGGGATAGEPTTVCDPGPVDASALCVEGHPLLLSPFVRAARPSSSTTTYSSMAAGGNKPVQFARTQSVRSNVSSTTGLPPMMMKDAVSERPFSNENSNSITAGAAIECLAVPEAFYDTLRSVHGVLCDDGHSVTFQADDSERLLLHHQPYHHGHHGHIGGDSHTQTHTHDDTTAGEPPPPRPIEFRRKLVPSGGSEDGAEADGDGGGATNNNISAPSLSLMDKLMAEEEQRRQPKCSVEVHPLKLVYATATTTTTTTGSSRDSEETPTAAAAVVPSGFGLVSRQALSVDALAALLRAAFPRKATQAVRFWCKCSYQHGPSSSSSGAAAGGPNSEKKNASAKQQKPQPPTQIGDGYELVDMQDLESRRISLQEWAQHLVPATATASTAVNEIHLLVETRPNVNAAWPRQAQQLSERLRVGDCVDAQDVAGKWYEAVVRHADEAHVTVHYIGWASRWEAKIPRQQQQEDSKGAQPPAPLWSRTERWRERLQLGHAVEVRDTSSRAERPKWYRGVVRKVGSPTDAPRELEDGAELEVYPVIDSGKNKEGDTDNDDEKKERLLLLKRTQQVLVEVEQERMQTSAARHSSRNLTPTSPEEGGLTPQPPYLRWVDVYGEEICRLGTHLKEDDGLKGPVTLQYEYDSNRKPVEILKTKHPGLGMGFMRESLRGTPPAPGSVGLQNLGQTCFLNSTVQCLNHIEPLTQFFLQDKHMKDLNRKNPLGSGGNVALAYASLLKKMWSGEYSVVAPRLLKQAVASFAPQFDNSYQHDSQEFCQFLMDGLHEDLNRVKSKPYVEELEGFGMDDEKVAIESWRKHLLRHDSIIVDHCQGMHRSHLTCPRCGRESIKFDIFSSISLPLATTKKRNSIQLEDCLEKFMEGEQLDERNAWYCPSCRQHVCALKMIALWSVPDILILHLKRFTFDTCMTSGSMLRSKMDDTVEFPIDGLDLTKHILGPIDPQAPPVYRLFGVSEHVGPTANSGHYTATARNSIDSQWYRCNDSHVGQTSGEASMNGGAYLLFYQRAKGITKWAGMGKAMKERDINPYGGLDTDLEGFSKVKTKKKKKKKG